MSLEVLGNGSYSSLAQWDKSFVHVCPLTSFDQSTLTPRVSKDVQGESF